MTRALPTVIAGLTLLVACKPGSKIPDGGFMPLDGGIVDTLSSDEQTAFENASQGQHVSRALTKLADSCFDFDPVLNPADSASMNATAVEMQLKTEATLSGGVHLISYFTRSRSESAEAVSNVLRSVPSLSLVGT